MKRRRNASEEEHDVEMNGRNGYVKSELSPASTPLGPKTRARRACVVKQTKTGPQTPGPTSGIGGVRKKELKKKVKKKLKNSLESITFEKILQATSSPSCGSRSNLTIPAWFIKEHGDKLKQSVVLRSAATKKKWTVHIGIYYPRNAAQVKFYTGWRDFAISNGLDEGDLLVFCLRQVSQFDVYIYRKARGPDSAPSLEDAEPPRKKSKTTILPHRKKYTKKAKQIDAKLLPKCEQLALTDASPTSPGFNSVPRQPNQNHLPYFLKTMVASNLRVAAFLEIPQKFAMTHGKQLRPFVKLQGFTEGSPVCVVSCKFNEQRRQTRLYLRSGWSTFVSDNNLRLGQVLEFTLTGNSFFVVKEALAMIMDR